MAKLILDPTAAQGDLAFRLAGPAAMTSAALKDLTADANACATLNPSALSETAREGFDIWLSHTDKPNPDLAGFCTTYPVDGQRADLEQALERLSSLETALPGAVPALLSNAFGIWLTEDNLTRLPRLVGSEDAVRALVQAYFDDQPQTAPPPEEILQLPLPASCVPTGGASTLRFNTFTDTLIGELSETVDIAALIDPLLNAPQPSRSALWTEIETAVTGKLDACAIDQMRAVVFHETSLGLAFTLDPVETANLVFSSVPQTTADAITPLIGSSAQSRDAVLSGAEAAIRKAEAEVVAAETKLSADTLAAAAEPALEVFDTPPEDVPAFDAVDLPEQLTVTEATLNAALAVTPDATFRDALTNAPYQPATQPQMIVSDALRALEGPAKARVDAAVAATLSKLSPAVSETWSLNKRLRTALLDQPALQTGEVELDAEALATQLETLIGLSYPYPRLMEVALADAGLDPKTSPIGATALTLTDTSLSEEEAEAERIYGPIAAPCGCVPKRGTDSEVHAFYPFWFYPTKPDPNAPEPAEGEEPPATTPEPVDFETISHISFYGLEMARAVDEDGQQTGLVITHHENQWIEAKRSFINSAHRHRARADLSLTLRGWDSWTADQMSNVTKKIDRLSAPFKRFPTRSFADIRAGLPTLFDAPQVDSVTLILDGYATADEDAIEQVRIMISTLSEVLRERDQLLNLAIDTDLSEATATQGLFDNLKQVLVEDAEGVKLVNRVLVFLERKTSKTKKRMRFRMEQGFFQGEDRQRTLRSIVPVLPPSGHELVLRSNTGATSAETPPGAYSQFDDDIIYFNDNFGGVAFWPMPIASAPETPELAKIIGDRWDVGLLANLSEPASERVVELCTWACPNRSYLALIAMVTFAVLALLTWRSFYSGNAHFMAFKLGLVWIMLVIVLVLLGILQGCDHEAYWPPKLLTALVVWLILIMVFNIYQRARNGPKP